MAFATEVKGGFAVTHEGTTQEIPGLPSIAEGLGTEAKIYARVGNEFRLEMN